MTDNIIRIPVRLLITEDWLIALKEKEKREKEGSLNPIEQPEKAETKMLSTMEQQEGRKSRVINRDVEDNLSRGGLRTYYHTKSIGFNQDLEKEDKNKSWEEFKNG